MKAEAKTYRKQIGKNIRSIRGMKAHSQKQVATYLQMSISNLSNIENGYTSIDTFKLKKIAEFFQVKEDFIIEFHQNDYTIKQTA